MIVRRQVEMVQTIEVNDETSNPLNLVALAKAFTNEDDWEIVTEKLEVTEKKEPEDHQYAGDGHKKDDWLRNLK